ncbi:hypothetical protein [Thalassotalea agariperforans]
MKLTKQQQSKQMKPFNPLILLSTVNLKKLLFPLFLLLLSGCELIPSPVTNKPATVEILPGNFNYQQYYLAIKSMPVNVLQQEADSLKNQTNSTVDEIKLALLYCLPNSPIHNPYNAKAILNKFTDKQSKVTFSQDNQAFLVLLKDLLNQQLFVFDKYNKKSQNQTSTIAELAEQVQLLQAQIEQLKKIETSLNNRG